MQVRHPDIPGLDTFPGTAFHSARWNHEVDLTGQRVAVVGTGASTVQSLPEIQPKATHVDVFQSTPQWVLLKPDYLLPPGLHRFFAHHPAARRALRGLHHWTQEAIGVPRLASQGFVVMTLNTNALWDFPADRSRQQLAALTYLTAQSTVKNRIDPGRLAVMGWSMGGGSLQSAASTPSLKAAIPLAPWDLSDVSSRITVPTMIFGADGDTVASVDDFALPFYNGLASAPDKSLIVLKDTDHFTFTDPNTTIAQCSVSWLKRFVDNDTRYDQFLCPTPNDPNTVVFQITCPL